MTWSIDPGRSSKNRFSAAASLASKAAVLCASSSCAQRLGGGEQEQLTAVLGKRLQAPREALLDAPGERLRSEQPEAAGELRRRQTAGQLEQGQRVAAGLGDDAVAHALVEQGPDS